MQRGWKTRHEVEEGACTECQGSTYVPAYLDHERMVKECPTCEGSGKDAKKKAA